jgi:deazaflavin-dependent oxidoreductase (nitroreductase family)
MLLSHIGRKTGHVYRQPISYVRDAGVLLTPGGGKWKLNLREDQPVTLRLRGHDVQARPEFVRDIDEVDRLLRHMVARSPRLNSFVPFVERDGTIRRAALENALRHDFCILRWHLAAPTTS